MEDYHIEKIKKLIKLEYGYDVDSPTRKREIVETRAMYYTILKEFTNLTLAGIARTVGKNHATILHGLNNFKNWKKQNKYLNYAYKSIKHIFISATWWEREIWDLFGIYFLNLVKGSNLYRSNFGYFLKF